MYHPDDPDLDQRTCNSVWGKPCTFVHPCIGCLNARTRGAIKAGPTSTLPGAIAFRALVDNA